MLGIVPITQWYFEVAADGGGGSGAVPTCVERMIVGCCGDTTDAANIGEPTLARMEGVTNSVNQDEVTGLELVGWVTAFTTSVSSVDDFASEGVAIGQSFEVVCVTDNDDAPTNDYYTIIPETVTAELAEGEWYYLWWIGEGFVKRVAFVAKFAG